MRGEGGMVTFLVDYDCKFEITLSDDALGPKVVDGIMNADRGRREQVREPAPRACIGTRHP